MTLDEACEILEGAAWTHETPLVTLLDEVVELYDAPMGVNQDTGKEYPGKITRAFAEYTRAYVSSGRVVQLLISLRRQNGMMPLYELQAVTD